jgi:hypothetical protein
VCIFVYAHTYTITSRSRPPGPLCGDSNGLSSQPALAALCAAARGPRFAGHILLVGADANTQTRARDRFHQGVAAFREFLSAQGLASAWDAHPDPARLTTTCAARTCLQTQIHKAVPYSARGAARANLKDWILGDAAQVIRAGWESLSLSHTHTHISEFRTCPPQGLDHR